MITYQESKGKDKVVQRVRPFTVGWSILPEAGGLLDQPHRLMTLLELFMYGDRLGFAQDTR